MEVKSREVANKMTMMVASQVEDTGSGVTSQMFAEKIREVFNVDVDNALVEDFMQGLGSQLTSYMFTLTAEAFSLLVFYLMGSAKLQTLLKKNAGKAWSYFKKILSSIPTNGGGKASVISTDIIKGQNQEVAVLEDIRWVLDSSMVYNNRLQTVDTVFNASDKAFNGVMQAQRAKEGESQATGAEELLKAILEFKALSKTGI